MYERQKVFESALEHFQGDSLAANVWVDKYCLKDGDKYMELSPLDTHKRLTKEFVRIEQKYPNPLNHEEIYNLLSSWTIIPGGSLLYGIGNNYSISSLGNCFSWNTNIITSVGIVPIGSLEGKNPLLYSEKGQWIKSEVKCFGQQEIVKLTLQRQGKQKVIETTADHIWYAKKHKNSTYSEYKTSELQEGYRMKYNFALNYKSYKPSPFGVAHGFYIGDGDKYGNNRTSKHVTLFPHDEELLGYFVPNIYPYGTHTKIGGIPNYFKELPSLKENVSYLYGYLAGYFAADGCIDERGSILISSVDINKINHIKDVCAVLGIGTYSISKQDRISNLTKKESTIYNIRLMSSTLNESFFIKKVDRERFKENSKKRYWIVKDIEYTGKVDNVYCAIVPGTNNFTLEDNILTHNCFVIGNNADSYGGIFSTDQEQAQLMKRRAGVGHDISHLRPANASVTNAAGTSTGAASFMHRFSNTTREVAQNGRRGALMLSMDIKHPDIDNFITAKDDTTKVTGANISVRVSDDFMKEIDDKFSSIRGHNYFLWNKLVHQAWKSAEPGVLFWDTILTEDVPSCYGKEWEPTSTNPCFHPDTLVETVKGRIKIKDITEPIKVYSMNKYGKLCIRQATAAFKTKENAKTLKINLRNGNSIQVTPDHELYVHDKGKVKAKDLKIRDRLIHLSRNRRGKRYSGVKLTTQHYKDYVMEHRMVFEYCNYPLLEGQDVHHKDGNTFNNSIDNLELLSHSDHSKYTAINDNPQEHQVRDSLGRFISPEEKYPTKIVNVPDELKTNVKNKWYNSIVSIEEGETTDVYDITVEDTHNLIANNIVASNCGEIPLCPYDSCRLMSVNLTKYVDKPFTKEASFNWERFKHDAYIAQKLMDDVIDLEEEKINKILEKIDNDPEVIEIKLVERQLWEKILEKLLQGRRTGLSAIGLADTLAMLNSSYSGGIDIAESIYKTFAISAYKSSIDMAKNRGTFPIYDRKTESKNPFIRRIYKELGEVFQLKLNQTGRRNIALLTIPPSGTISLLAGISSGIEPVYQLSYKRRRKVDPDHPNKSFQDQNGDWWEEYTVLHPKYKQWIETANRSIDFCPYDNSTAYELNPLDRVKMQGVIQKWVDHSISSTVNLHKDTIEEQVSELYLEAWKQGLKGITIYRDGSRDGVLISKDTSSETFISTDAPKRPKYVSCDIFTPTTHGQQYVVAVGIVNDKPYEVFAFKYDERLNISKGFIKKVNRGRYDILDINKNIILEDITSEMSQVEEDRTRLMSWGLRHGGGIKFLVEQLNKAKGNGFQAFSRIVARTLKKYIKDNEEVTGATCESCGSTRLIYKDGCVECESCGIQKC